MKTFLLLAFLGLPAFACEKTQEEKFKYELSKYSGDFGYFGVYKRPHDDLRGRKVYIFPDKTFAIVGFCDICMGEELLAKGGFKYFESKIELTFTEPYDGKKKIVYELRTGSKEYAGYSTGSVPLMLDENELRRFSYGKSFLAVFHNIEPYPDWQTKSQDFRSRRVLGK